MRISTDLTSLVSNDRAVIVEHGEGSMRRQVSFTIALYKRNHFSEDNAIFRPINEYWATLPERDQAEIYAVYEDVRELFDSVTGSVDLRNELTDLVTRLLSFHKTTDVTRWVEFHSGMEIPATVESEYVHNVDKNTTVDQTYVYRDYLGLMALSVIFRAMIPIWSMYSKPAKDATGKVHKERVCYLLMRDSELYHSEAIARLKRYVAANIGKDSYTGNHTLEFIPSSDLPDYLLSLVCVRKLCLGELYPTETDPVQNLAALTYTYIIDRPSPQGSDFSQQVREKKIKKEGAGETGENSGSSLEIYKARATVTPGRIAELEYALRDPVNLCIQLCPDADEYQIAADCKLALETSQAMLKSDIQPAQIVLAQWILAPVFPPQGLLYIKANTGLVVHACAITQTVLQHRGFEYLALLATSTAMVAEDSMRVAPMGSKSQIPEDLAEAIAKHFPYKRVPKRKTATNSSYCFVTEDVKRLAMEFSNHTWRATADEALVRKVLGTHVRRVTILPQLRADIMRMLVWGEEQLL